MEKVSAVSENRQIREIWPDILRIISVLAVIILHAGGAGFIFFKSARSSEWQVCNVYDALVRFGVPCFVMLSGMFILDPSRQYPMKKLFLQKIFRIAAAFFFWSAFYALFTVINICAYEYVHPVTALIIFARHWFDGYYHMWFLGMIIGLYLITPFLRVIVRDEKLTGYFLILALVFTAVPKVLYLLPETAAGNWICMVMDTMELRFAAGYSGYFVWGYWLSAHKLTAGTRKMIYILGIIGAFVTVAVNGIMGYWRNEIGTWTYDNLLPNVFLMATAVFVFCQYNFKAEQFSARWQQVIGTLGKWSFGIYLAHVFFLEHLHYIGLPNFFCAPAISVPVTTAAVFAASFVLVFLLSRIPILRKYVI